MDKAFNRADLETTAASITKTGATESLPKLFVTKKIKSVNCVISAALRHNILYKGHQLQLKQQPSNLLIHLPLFIIFPSV
jgi:hypothetical protein